MRGSDGMNFLEILGGVTEVLQGTDFPSPRLRAKIGLELAGRQKKSASRGGPH